MSPSPSSVSPLPPRPLRNALEGALAALCAVVAMAALAVVGLAVFEPASTDSLWALTMGVIAMAVGGSATVGPDTMPMPAASSTGTAQPAGGAANLTMSGTAHVFPLAITLFGAVVLWLVFSWGLRRRPFQARDLAARAVGAVGASVLVLWGAAALAHGSFTMPTVGGKGGASLGGPLGDLVEKLFGSAGLAAAAGSAAQPPMSYQVGIGATVIGALVWAVLVLVVGLLISRRLPAEFSARGLRASWAPSLSALVRTLLAVAAVLTLVGALSAGDRKAAGGALLTAPFALASFLSVGLGSTWTSALHMVQSPAAAAAAAGQAGQSAAGQAGGQAAVPPADHTQRLGDLTSGGMPVWLMSIVLTGLVLLACAYAAARATDPANARPLHPYKGPLGRHLGLAERFGIVTALVLGGAAALAEPSLDTHVTMAGHLVSGTEIGLDGGVLWTFVAGLLAGAVAGFAGSLLCGERASSPGFRFLPRKEPVAAATGSGAVVRNTVEPGA
ncbi:streptophobe family protein [Streptomyces sp. NPDC005811]|uniref:streptophobe family protein n=1 Tax=Streptomyces sp. NPDC005811 TaxID=3154565 RepID=UPI0033E54E5E